MCLLSVCALQQQRCAAQVAPKEVLFPKLALSRATGRCLAYPPMPLQATPVKLGSEFPEPADALDKLERQVPRFTPYLALHLCLPPRILQVMASSS